MTGRDYNNKIGNLIARLRGISTPLGGMQWEAPPPQRALVERLFHILEDKRVLFVAHELEIPHHCVQSILDIRQRLSALIDENPGEPLLSHLIAMRAACRKFLSAAGKLGDDVQFGVDRSHFASWRFLPAVGELRASVGIQVAILASEFSVAVPTNLEPILPEAEDGA